MTQPLFNNLLILGVGLMGGSLGMAVRNAGCAKKVSGWSRRESTLEKALASGAIDEYQTDLATALASADCVVIATPTQLAERFIVEVVQAVSADTLVTDVASVKGNLARALTQSLGAIPANVVLGHPVCGSEQSGVEAARDSLYQKQKVVLIKEQETSADNFARIQAMWQAVGAEVYAMTLQQHDQTLALTSHLPHMLSFALMNQLEQHCKDNDVFEFSGGGFRDFTRIAGSDPIMWKEIALANDSMLARAIDEFIAELGVLKQNIIDGDADALEALFERARNTRQNRLPSRNGSE